MHGKEQPTVAGRGNADVLREDVDFQYPTLPAGVGEDRLSLL